MDKYIVQIETNSGDKRLVIYADTVLDMYNKVLDYADFVRIKQYNYGTS